MNTTERPRVFGIPDWVPALLLLGVFAGAGIHGALRAPVLPDEPGNLAAGLTFLDRGDFRLGPEQPPLARLWAALPVWAAGGANRVPYEGAAWRGRGVLPGTTMTTGAEADGVGRVLLGFPAGGTVEPRSPLVRARLAQVALGVLLGLMVWGWSRELWGARGALLALFLYALSPAMLSRATVVTIDLAAAAGVTATLWALWRFTQEPNWVRGLWVGLALAAALLVKLSSLLLLPLVVLCGLAWVYVPRLEPWEHVGRAQRIALLLVAVLLLGYAGVWAGYGFRYEASPDDTYQLDWEAVGLQPGPPKIAIYETMERKLLPQAYLYALAHLAGGGEGAREVAAPGEPAAWYAPLTGFAWRTPPALLVLLAAALLYMVSRRDRLRSFDTWCLLLPVAVYGLAAVLVDSGSGHRALIPVLPVLCIAVGQFAWFANPIRDEEDGPAPALERARVWVLAALLVAYALSFAVALSGPGAYVNFLQP